MCICGTFLVRGMCNGNLQQLQHPRRNYLESDDRLCNMLATTGVSFPRSFRKYRKRVLVSCLLKLFREAPAAAQQQHCHTSERHHHITRTFYYFSSCL